MVEFASAPELSSFLKIHCCCYEENIFPWVQNNLRTPSWRFYYNSTPGGFLRVKNEEIPLLPENFYIIPGYMEFSTFAQSSFSQFYIHFSLSDRQKPHCEVLQLPAESSTLRRIKNLISCSTSPENHQFIQFSAMSILTGVLLDLPGDILKLPPEYDPRIKKVLTYLQKHPETAYSNAFLAKSINMSCNGFLRLFELQLGETPQAYSRRKRIERACELLHFSSLTIEEIAMATGFSDRYHFSRVFWKIMHFTPAAFRRQEKPTGNIAAAGQHRPLLQMQCRAGTEKSAPER